MRSRDDTAIVLARSVIAWPASSAYPYYDFMQIDCRIVGPCRYCICRDRGDNLKMNTLIYFTHEPNENYMIQLMRSLAEAGIEYETDLNVSHGHDVQSLSVHDYDANKARDIREKLFARLDAVIDADSPRAVIARDVEETPNVSETLRDLLNTLRDNRDGEISMASEVAGQYVRDHNDKAAYRAIDREVNQLARAWDKMIRLLEQTVVKAEKIEASCTNFYGR